MRKMSNKTKVLKEKLKEKEFAIRKKLFSVKRSFMHRESFFDITFYIFVK